MPASLASRPAIGKRSILVCSSANMARSTPRRRCVGDTATHDTPAIGSTAPPGTVTSRSSATAVPTTSGPSHATTAQPGATRLCHIWRASGGCHSPKQVAASSAIPGQSPSSTPRTITSDDAVTSRR